MIRRSQCQNETTGECAPSISGSIMGGEYSETYFLCKRWGACTVYVCHDRFLDEQNGSFRSPISKEEGGAKVELIHQRSEPWNKKCRCEAHRAYFGDCLD